MEPISTRNISTPVGRLGLAARDGRLTGVTFGGRAAGGRVDPGDEHVLSLAERQLAEYFAAQRTRFELPLDPPAAGVRGRVLATLAQVPYGETITYKDLALAAGLDAGAAREVGGVMASNPLVIVLPCHRVVGSDGSLTGFGGGLDTKRRLLDLESAQLQLA
jgi:methylated-DNA-[protein]-cysteine S-methyltransferase